MANIETILALTKILIHRPFEYISLYLSGKNLSDNEAIHILALLKKIPNNIASIDFSNNNLTDKTGYILACFCRDNPKIERLYLSGNKFTDNTFNKFATILETNRTLKRLEMYGNNHEKEDIMSENFFLSIQKNPLTCCKLFLFDKNVDEFNKLKAVTNEIWADEILKI